MSAQCNA